jgi:hypothetical protein
MRAIGLFLAGLVAAVCTGCGEGGEAVKVTGQVLKNGASYTLADGEAITINLISTDGKSTCSTGVQPDGTFSVQKPSGGPVPVGKYKVSYIHNRSSAQGASKTFTNSVKKTVAEEWDISPSSTSFTLDISKG